MQVSSVMVECDTGENFILANLNLKTCSENLNVSFNEGEKICFKVGSEVSQQKNGGLKLLSRLMVLALSI